MEKIETMAIRLEKIFDYISEDDYFTFPKGFTISVNKSGTVELVKLSKGIMEIKLGPDRRTSTASTKGMDVDEICFVKIIFEKEAH